MVVPHTEITVTQDGAEIVRKSVPPGDYVIGREAGCDVPVEAGKIAPRHAQITINYDHALIEDLGSDSGTFVNGRRVTESTRLWPGQKIQVGPVTVTLRREKVIADSDQSLAPQAAAVRQLLPEELLRDAKYEIDGQIAQGGMGAILNAKEVAIRREVAMKVMLNSSDQEDLRRFVEEAQITGQLEHPNIVPVHELNVDENDQVFYTMKLVRGVTLRRVFDLLAEERGSGVPPESSGITGGTPVPLSKKYPLSALLTVFQKVCDALAFAHSRGVIHRDLKPENIMLGDYGEVLVMDWGLAKQIGGRRFVAAPSSLGEVGADKAAPSSGDDPAAANRTMAGTIMGTPQYMAPEQARGEIDALDARSDIYALGAILYHALTLCSPINATSLDDILAKVRAGEIIPPIERKPSLRPHHTPPPAVKVDAPLSPIEVNAPTVLQSTAPVAAVYDRRGAGGLTREDGDAHRAPLQHLPDGSVPESLNAVVMKAMALEPAARYQSVEELQADIAAYQSGFATRAERAGLGKQLVLLIKRHKGVFSTAAAAWFIITALAVWFVIKITASERETRRQAQIARTNEQRAVANEQRAVANEQRATASEQEALAEKENVRRALAKSALALAEAAYREADGPAMQSALDQVPADLRDANWSYLLEQSDNSMVRLAAGPRLRGIAAHPKQASVFATANDKQEIELVRVNTGGVVSHFGFNLGERASNTTYSLAISADGERIAIGKGGSSGEIGGGIAIHHLPDGAKLLQWDTAPVAKLEFSADGTRLLQLGKAKEYNCWDARDGKLLWDHSAESVNTAAGAIMPDGKQAILKLASSALVLCDLKDGKETRRLYEKASGIKWNHGFAVHPNGSAVLWGDSSGHVQCIDTRDGRLLFARRAHVAGIQAVAFSTDGERFVSVAYMPDGRQSIVLSDARTGDALMSLLGGSSYVSDAVIHPLSGELLVSGYVSRAWDTTGTPPRWSFRVPAKEDSLGGAVFVHSDDLFLGPANSFRTNLRNLTDSTILWSPTRPGARMPSLSADGSLLAVADPASTQGEIQFVRLDGAKVVSVHEFKANKGASLIALSPRGDQLAVAPFGSGKQVTIFDPATGAVFKDLNRGTVQTLRDLRWITGGTELIAITTVNKVRGLASSEERIIVWNAASGQQVRSVVHPTALNCLVVAPDGKSFAAAGADKLVHVFDTETLAERQAFRAHDGAITALAWHPSRPIVATGSADLTIKVWNLDTGRRLETLRGPIAAPRVLNFSPSGQRLACASEDRMVRIWEPKPLNNALLDAPATDGWEDLLAKLKADEVKANGNGWTLSGGLLLNPKSKAPPMVLPGSFARSSYTLRTSVRQVGDNIGFSVAFPVGERQAIFELDYRSDDGIYRTGLGLLGSRTMKEIVETITTRQVSESDPHDLEITVNLGAKIVQIKVTLDDRSIYEWSGAADDVRLPAHWPTLPPSTVAFGWNNAAWVVSAVKVKRLDAGK